MTLRILFIASLHHPEQLHQDRAAALAGAIPPLFPTSMGQHFWARAMRKHGYELDVFWRNQPGFFSSDITSRKSDVHTQRVTPSKVVTALMRRLPPQANLDYRLRNRHLIEKARDFQPDILWVIGDNTVIYAETLATIKEQTNCKIVYASGTSPLVFSHSIERRAARLYDLVLVNDYYHGIQWLELGAQQMECLPIAAIDPNFHYPRQLTIAEQEKYSSDVTFVGTLVPDHLYSERIQALAALPDFDPAIWSVHDVPDILRPYLRGYALGDEMMQVLSAAKVSLNIHGDFMRYGGNMRLFEAAAVGAFQIVDNRPGINEWFTSDKHLITFRDNDELRQKVRYYLKHEDEREAIATAAREHVLQNHTYDHRLDRVEELMQELWGWEFNDGTL